MALATQFRDLLGDEAQNPLAHYRAEPILKNPLEILNPGLHRGLNAFISLHSVGWFKRLFKTDGVGTPSDQPALLLSNILTEINPPPNTKVSVIVPRRKWISSINKHLSKRSGEKKWTFLALDDLGFNVTLPPNPK
jgi:hypothetical protein